jgi:two-component system NtrC family sensor kinase
VCPDYKLAEAGNQPVPMVEISVIDSGCGISKDNLQRIFDPFFTTKGVGRGTGLGLSVSHGTIRAHGGEIEVESSIEEGSQFRIYLPIGGVDANDNNGSDQ